LGTHHSLWGEEIATVMESMWWCFCVVGGCTSKQQSHLVLIDNKLRQWFLSLCTQWYIFTCNSEFELWYGCHDKSLPCCLWIQHNGFSLRNQPTFNPLVTYHGKIACCIFTNNIGTYCIYFMVILWCNLLYCHLTSSCISECSLLFVYKALIAFWYCTSLSDVYCKVLVAGRLTLVVTVTEGREIAFAVGFHVTHTHTLLLFLW
jgi:hypothetical protein